MLELKNIKKDYPAGAGVVHALKGIDLKFRKSEFVSILGQSGCGKTTMLNIIGGLDGYTEGDLVINGTSTKEYKDRDWDTYRNHSVGFVFQSYNLIPHQTVLQNVELALTLSGVKKDERRERAIKALEQVGLGDQLKKKPNEMSGGQMQRVSIARALVNNPDIILADEPTGALDTETSVQVMEVLKEISKDRLVVMVTHNPELAEKYSSRIIKMLDGEVKEDTSPLTEEEIKIEEERCAELKRENEGKKVKKPSMSFFTSFMLSLKNLFTKKGRTLLTAFAGSIGIIGIALILAVSQGMTAYINHVQETTLSSYPINIESQNIDIGSLMQSFMGIGQNSNNDKDAIYKDPVVGELVDALSKLQVNKNDLGAFKKYIEEDLKKEDSKLKDILTGIQYTYSITPTIYTIGADGKVIKSDVSEILGDMLKDFYAEVIKNGGGETLDAMMGGDSSSMGSGMMGSMMNINMWQELLPGLNGEPVNDIIKDQYDLVYGSWPNDKEEIVLVLDENNQLNDLTLYALGLMSKEEIDAIIKAAASGNTLGDNTKSWPYETITSMKYKAILPYDCYEEKDGLYVEKSETEPEEFYKNSTIELEVVGIIRPNEDASTTMLSGSICYTHELTKYYIEKAKDSEVVKAQLDNPNIDIFTGKPFKSSITSFDANKKADYFSKTIEALKTDDEKKEMYINIECLKEELLKLESLVKEDLDKITEETKDMYIAGILATMGENAELYKDYITNMSVESLKKYLEDGFRAGHKAKIRAEIITKYKDITIDEINEIFENYTVDELALFYVHLTDFSESTYENNLLTIGCVDINVPATINIYVSSFENKDVVAEFIKEYNSNVDETKKISYTDLLGIMMSSITTIINAITYVLIAFVSISLVVSSIMIGVITLISVQERTKEIGILRAIGASKRDVSSMFNAETMIIGFASGMLGVIVTYILCIPINIILHAVTGIGNLNAILPIGAAAILVAISVVLTLISGLIPSRSAAKKDPVVALRTE